MESKLVLISGNLGVGKTTLAKKIGTYLKWHVGYESVADNPYLVDFYTDMKSWSYQLQVYFLGHRANQHLFLSTISQNAILDRSIYEDGFIFAKSLHDSGFISDRDYNSYMTLFNYVIETLPKPDLLIYVKASIETVVDRIKVRGQKFDQDLDKDYLKRIDEYYLKWTSEYNLCPILIIDSDKYDYVNNEEDFLSIIDLLKNKLNYEGF